jgi:hypothetical protein
MYFGVRLGANSVWLNSGDEKNQNAAQMMTTAKQNKPNLT